MRRTLWYVAGALTLPAIVLLVWMIMRSRASCDEFGCVVPLDEESFTRQAARARLSQDDIFRRWDGQ